MNQKSRIDLRAFEGEEHLPFRLEGSHPVAVLLVHGFPGTPAEMRPLAELIHQQGATVEVPLLPGFGHQIATLAGRNRTEWVECLRSSLTDLRRTHPRVVLAGFSMGAALSIIAAQGSNAPDHLLLLAPFWQLGKRWHQPLWPIVRLLLREFKPFARADLDDLRIRRDLRRSMPAADLDDPAVRMAVRQISFPSSVIDQIIRTGHTAWKIAPQLDLPLTVIQGSEDQIVSPAATRRLASRFLHHPTFFEVKADHQLTDLSAPEGPLIARLVTDCIFEESE